MNANEKKICIFDIDGTISNPTHRRHFVKGDEPDWKSFNEKMTEDTVNETVVSFMNAMRSQGYFIVIFTGRSDEYMYRTQSWLAFNDVEYHELYMRRGKTEADHRDSVVKNRMLSELLQDYPNKSVFFACDDRPQVIREVWNKHGIWCFDVNNGVGEF